MPLVPLKERRQEILEYVRSNRKYIKHNEDLFDIYSGNLLPYVENLLRNTLSPQYFQSIQHRIIPINVLTRIIQKLAKCYANDPIRRGDVNQDVVDYYEDAFGMNMQMNRADEFAQMFKGYALEPYIHNGIPRLRVLPYDRFLVMSSSFIDPLQMDTFIKFIGERTVINKRGKPEIREVFFTYTDEEFDAFDMEGDDFLPALMESDGTNDFGVIPFLYGNRDMDKILPTQDTDLLQNSKIMPVFFSDLGGAIMYQCFAIIFGIDINMENINKSPNALWSLKSDPQSDKKPELGTIKGEVDVEKVLLFISQVFSTWLETKGVKIGNTGQTDGRSNSSGIAKIIDEMDTFEIRKTSIQFFQKEEMDFWRLMGIMHNKWIDQGLLRGQRKISSELIVTTEFDEPQPFVDRKEMVTTKALEVREGFLDRRSAIKDLYRDLDEEGIDERLALVAKDQIVNIQ